MIKRGMTLAVALLAAAALPAAAQTAPTRFSVMPYVGYGFYGELPDNGPELEGAVAYGARAAYQLSPQWALFGNFQRSEPQVASIAGDRQATVDHWSAGVEFSYAPRGGAEGILPVMLEAGVGQARYDFGSGILADGKVNDIAVNLGISSAFQLSRGLAIRYGANDYVSNFEGDRGLTNQIFVNIGAELSF